MTAAAFGADIVVDGGVGVGWGGGFLGGLFGRCDLGGCSVLCVGRGFFGECGFLVRFGGGLLGRFGRRGDAAALNAEQRGSAFSIVEARRARDTSACLADRGGVCAVCIFLTGRTTRDTTDLSACAVFTKVSRGARRGIAAWRATIALSLAVCGSAKLADTIDILGARLPKTESCAALAAALCADFVGRAFVVLGAGGGFDAASLKATRWSRTVRIFGARDLFLEAGALEAELVCVAVGVAIASAKLRAEGGTKALSTVGASAVLAEC